MAGKEKDNKQKQEVITTDNGEKMTVVKRTLLGKGASGKVSKLQRSTSKGDVTLVEKIIRNDSHLSESDFNRESDITRDRELLIATKMTDDELALYMPYLGKSADDFIKNKSLTADDILILIYNILTEINKIHNKHDLVHSDVKLANFFIKRSTSEGSVGDYGLTFKADETSEKHNLGTPLTMAPEAYEKQSKEGDVYSTGISLIMLLLYWLKNLDSKSLRKELENGTNELLQDTLVKRPENEIEKHYVSFKSFTEDFSSLLQNKLNLTKAETQSFMDIISSMVKVEANERAPISEVLESYKEILKSAGLLLEKDALIDQIKNVSNTVNEIISDLEKKHTWRSNFNKDISVILGNQGDKRASTEPCKSFYELQTAIKDFNERKDVDQIVAFEFRNRIVANLQYLQRKKTNVLESKLESPRQKKKGVAKVATQFSNVFKVSEKQDKSNVKNTLTDIHSKIADVKLRK